MSELQAMPELKVIRARVCVQGRFWQAWRYADGRVDIEVFTGKHCRWSDWATAHWCSTDHKLVSVRGCHVEDSVLKALSDEIFQQEPLDYQV